MSIAEQERSLYREMWNHEAYRKFSPGEQAVPRFLSLMPTRGEKSVVDFGCGTGRASLALQRAGFVVLLVDQTREALDPEASGLSFLEHCLWHPWPYPHVLTDYGFCCDVLEHIPTELTALTIARMLEPVEFLYLEVSTEPDEMGVLVGQPLHKTIKPFVWWRDLCREIGTLVDGVDLLTRAVFVLKGRS
jgi:SAM-dependent methyltransferase